MTEPAHPELSTRRRRLIFRAHHRGIKENDVLIGGFVANRIAELSEAEMDQIEEILELPDVDLTEWLTGRQPIPAEMDSPMLRRMRDAAGK